ncbi:hypothetical protein PYW08_005330 [Mythimna loreyi]|uniref:Uncharacterized protein n=1 Tax=Mythimna loreyi TaxID=667449 RepID=A0ACC2QI99_9NEOP|nr:hypothetical protein PYW08_005330 [Mythimna loreyi]
MKRSKSYTWLSGLLRAKPEERDADEWGAAPWVRADVMHHDSAILKLTLGMMKCNNSTNIDLQAANLKFARFFHGLLFLVVVTLLAHSDGQVSTAARITDSAELSKSDRRQSILIASMRAVSRTVAVTDRWGTYLSSVAIDGFH